MSCHRAGVTHPMVEAVACALQGYRRETLEVEGFRRAAVLVPLVLRDGRLELLFTVRSVHLTHHAGQIAFPGGGVDPGEDAVDAALRETSEEIGVRLGREAVLGMLDDLPSPARYVATPVVALMDPAAEPVPNPAEVAATFVAPVAELRRIVPSWEERRLEGVRRRIHYYPWNGRTIWGFTGNVLKNFLDATGATSAAAPGSGASGRAW